MAPATVPRSVLALVAIALLAAGVVVAAGAAAIDESPQPSIRTPENTTGHLQPESDGEAESAYVEQDVDVGVAVSADVAAIRARHESMAFERAIASADGRAERLTIVRDRLDRLEAETEAVLAGTREARTAFLEGSLSREAFLQRVARLDAHAASLERHRGVVERRLTTFNPQPQTSLTTAQNLEATLETIQGPASTRVRGRYAGNLSAGATYVSVAGSEGLVIATVVDGDLFRDAVDETERDPDGADRFAGSDEPEISVALRRAAVVYPWAFENGNAAQPLRGYGDTAVYRITVEHTQGRLSTYLDGATENVFREIQRLQPSAVPVTDQAGATASGLQLHVNTTHATGPLAVSVERASSGAPVDATVTIDGTVVGRTGGDGDLWTVQPEGRFRVAVTTADGDSVNVAVG